jgi:hypothetical protein
MPIFSLALLSKRLPLLLGGRFHHHIPEAFRCLGVAIARPYARTSWKVNFCELRLYGVLRS